MVTKLQKKVEDLDRVLKQKNDELEVSSLHNLYCEFMIPGMIYQNPWVYT